MAKALVVYASKYGGTAEIAQRIGARLNSAGMDSTVAQAGSAVDPADFDVVVVGSAVYMFRWRAEAVRFLKSNHAPLAQRGVWLFSSGPTTEKDLAEMRSTWKLPGNAQDAIEGLNVRGNEVFGGVAYPEKMTGFHRWMWKSVKAEAADVRDWDAIEAWADRIAAQ